MEYPDKTAFNFLRKVYTKYGQIRTPWAIPYFKP